MADFTPAPIKPSIAFAALDALDIRVGTIERVEESRQIRKTTQAYR